MTREEAIASWMDNDGWQFADREAAWKWMYQAGWEAAIAAVKAGGVVAFEHRCPDSAPLYKLPEQSL